MPCHVILWQANFDGLHPHGRNFDILDSKRPNTWVCSFHTTEFLIKPKHNTPGCQPISLHQLVNITHMFRKARRNQNGCTPARLRYRKRLHNPCNSCAFKVGMQKNATCRYVEPLPARAPQSGYKYPNHLRAGQRPGRNQNGYITPASSAQQWGPRSWGSKKRAS